MAVVTLYFQSLLILLIGFSNLVQGRSLLPPRNRQPVTEPRQTPGFTVLNSFGDRYMLSQSSRPKAQINAPFQGSGYLQVWPADFFSLSIGPLGWINSYGEWTNDEKRRALFDADVNRESGIAVLESNRGSCLIRTDTHLLDCVTKPVTNAIDTSRGKAIRVKGKALSDYFTAKEHPAEASGPVSLKVINQEQTKREWWKVHIEWVQASSAET